LLSLDQRRVLIVAETVDGYGDYLSHRDESRLRAATMKVLAGGCWLLLDDRRATDSFAEATKHYAELGRLFALVTAICAGRLKPPLAIDPSSSSGPHELAYRALWMAWMRATAAVAERDAEIELEWLAQEAERWGPCWVGHLRIPLDALIRLAKGSGRHAPERPATLHELPRLLGRVAEAVRIAMTDIYHWSRLQSGLQPVEPELLAVGRVAHEMLRRRWSRHTLDELGVGSGIDRVPLWLARRMDPPWPSRRIKEPRPDGPNPQAPSEDAVAKLRERTPSRSAPEQP
jgi:hypothetical protein